MSVPDADTYALKSGDAAEIAAPDLDYLPPRPAGRHRIALVGAGGIAGAHLEAYRAAGFDVAAIMSRSAASAAARRDEFFPAAAATDDLSAILDDPAITILDITPHPGDRAPLIERALRAGKHVLSQKPFAEDMQTATRLADLADAQGVLLAVNQNGRWAPHMAWMRQAVRQGLIGEVTAVSIAIHWDHSWIQGTGFEDVPQLILYDFGIHWFDFLATLVGPRLRDVHAAAAFAAGQAARVPLLSQAMVGFEGGQAALFLAGATPHGPRDTAQISGTLGSLVSDGPDLGRQSVTLTTAAGRAVPDLQGTWFNDGFAGAMGELMCAIEQGRAPLHSARDNLTTLKLTFAAMESARSGAKVDLT